MARVRWIGAGSLAVLAVVGAAGCTEKKVASDDPSVQVVQVALSDVGCEPSSMSAKAGATTFAVANEDASGVTEFELMTEDRGRVLGEAENVGPGLESSFSLNLAAGSYTMVATLDSTNVLPESNEADNVATSATATNVSAPVS